MSVEIKMVVEEEDVVNALIVASLRHSLRLTEDFEEFDKELAAAYRLVLQDYGFEEVDIDG